MWALVRLRNISMIRYRYGRIWPRIAHNRSRSDVARQRTDLGVVVYRSGQLPPDYAPCTPIAPCAKLLIPTLVPAAGWKAMHVEIKTPQRALGDSYRLPHPRDECAWFAEAQVFAERVMGVPHNPRESSAGRIQRQPVRLVVFQRGEHALPMSHLSRVAMCALPAGECGDGPIRKLPIAARSGMPCCAPYRVAFRAAAAAAYRMHWSAGIPIRRAAA
jgi:hypothetical protein